MMATVTWARVVGVAMTVLVVAAASATGARTQIPMPDPREMSGIPLPTGDLPDGTITVRLIRGQLSNNITDHPVELREGTTERTERTDASGRARFSGVSPGTLVSVAATVGDESLTSRPFAVPAQGGIRIMLVGTSDPATADTPDAESAPAESAASDSGAAGTSAASVTPGRVIFGGDSRWVIEMSEEAVEVYYLLEAVNAGSTPVTPAEPVQFELPAGAQAATVLEGSSPQTRIMGSRVVVDGPFEPGRTAINVAYVLPYSGGSLEIAQRMPAALEQVAVIAEKRASMQMTSPQITQSQERELSGLTYLVGGGPGVPSGGTLRIRLSGLPHRSTSPRNVAMALVALLTVWTLWCVFASRETPGAAYQRKTLQARREKLYGELVRIELEQRQGRLDDGRHSKRRQELIAQLERVYRRLDQAERAVVGGQPITPS